MRNLNQGPDSNCAPDRKIQLARERFAGTEPVAAHGEIGNGRSRGSGATSTSEGRGAEYHVARLKRDASLPGDENVEKAAMAQALLDDVMDDKISPDAAAKQRAAENPTTTLRLRVLARSAHDVATFVCGPLQSRHTPPPARYRARD